MTMRMNEMFYGGNQPHWLKNDEYQRPYDYTADYVYPTSGRTLPTHEFWVPMCCPKCEEKVREELSELDGVYEVFVDQVQERVTVTGFVDAFQALKKMKRIKKKSQFWDDGPLSSATFKYSSHKRVQSFSPHKKPRHSRHHETVYRASPSQISYNRQPRPRLNKFYGSYDDEVSYSGTRRNSSYDDEVSYSGAQRNEFYDDGLAGYRPASTFNRKYFGAYDDQEIAYRPASTFNRKYYGASDDQEISYRPANKFSGAYDDEIIGFRSDRNQYNDSPYLRPSSSLFSRSVPPFAQEYYSEEPVEQYPY